MKRSPGCEELLLLLLLLLLVLLLLLLVVLLLLLLLLLPGRHLDCGDVLVAVRNDNDGREVRCPGLDHYDD